MGGNVFDEQPTNRIFQNVDALDPDRTPSKDEFVERDDEMQQIVSILRFIEMGGASNFLVTGPSGVGKTMAVKIILRDLENYLDGNVQSVYLTDLENELQTLRTLTSQLSLNYRGTDLNEYYDRLAAKLIREDLKLVLVLDELEKLFLAQGGKSHGNSFLKKLLEARKRVVNADADGTLLVIGISNNARLGEYMNTKVKSRFGHETVHFSKYNALELRKILEQRSEKAFRPGALDDGVLAKIAAVVAQNGGDAREAIQVLRKAGELALDDGAATVTNGTHVDRARQLIEADKIVDTVRSLSMHSHVVVYAVLSLLEEGKTPVTTGDVYSEYRDVHAQMSVEGKDPISQRRVRDLIAELDMLGVIQATVLSNGKYGRTRRIKVNLEESTIEELQTFVEEEYGI
ncbi:AAA family ATPase [Haloterrigena sp. SYSU A558-1]|uniref:ORC1-type DNA replication protein n=1 Tax=Haloterrigena gelatinilytica TaxID=2741724 RepID=A0ABX2LC81_9EURY|nr:AAA family ATPase [Haloterrigena gelatinilytica]NUC70709.1 AAA family ATPase [Haloterrigena gelatinilytica]